MPLRREPHPRFLMKKLSKQLRNGARPSAKLALFAAGAFDKFLAGKSPTLDAAFGLQKKRGVPGWPKARLKMAKETRILRKEKKSWRQVQAELKKRGYKDTDLSTIKRTLKEFRLYLMEKDIWQILKPDFLQD